MTPPVADKIPMSRERVLRAAIDFADRQGIESLTMRKLAGELGVEAMTLYYYVTNKNDLLEGMTDVVALNFPTLAYDHANPDKYRLPVDSDLIPHKFPAGTRGY